MSMRAKLFLILGVLFALAFIIGQIVDNPSLRLITKPVPVLLMALYVVLVPEKGAFQWLIVAGLLLGALGDFFLELSPNAFLWGLTAFLIGHLFYITAFTLDTRRPAWIFAVFAYLYGLILFSYLDMGKINRTGEMSAMALPVALYILVITTMVWRAAARFHAPGVPELSGRAGLMGAILFALSDSLLAILLFVQPLPYASILVILLYWLGQLGITLAAVTQHSAGMASVS